ncbi:MAG: hypothetical protein OEL20_05175 [Sulfuritalea sp.]|nr:hypothetical protein [Sulfuritalea sp.]
MRTRAEDNTTARPSMISTLLAVKPAAMPPPPPGAVRRHLLDNSKPGGVSATAEAALSERKPQEFSAADKALIRRVHVYMNPLQLLGILNTRLACDVGDRAAPYTIDQLRSEIASVSTAVPAEGNDWGSLRKLLAKARRTGVLGRVDEQVINDFAVVFSLNQKQVLILKDIVLPSEEEES